MWLLSLRLLRCSLAAMSLRPVARRPVALVDLARRACLTLP